MITTFIPVTGLLPTKAGFTGQTKQTNDGNTGTSGLNDIWPLFRHDPANTGCTDYYSPNTNHVTWKKQLNTQIGQTTPLLYGDKLYISTGWYYKSVPKITNLFNITPSPPSEILQELLEQQSITAPGLYCLNAKTGEEFWNLSMDLPNDPAIVDNKLYMTAINYSYYSSALYCLDATTGSIIWQKPINGLALSPTIVADEKIFVGSLDISDYSGSMSCYDLSGNLLWNRPYEGSEVSYFSAPAVYEGKVYCITIDLSTYYNGKLYCLNAETGQILWSKPIFSFGLMFYQSISPVCADDKVYVTDFNMYGYAGYLRCFDAETGDSEWTHNFGQSITFSTPALCEGSVYVTSFDFYSYYSWLYRFYATNGTLEWKVALPSSSYFGFGSPICSADKILLSSGGYAATNELFCFEKENGTFVWNYLSDAEILGRQSIGDERAYAADVDGNIYMFEDVLKIRYVLGGFLGIHAIIQNSGNISLTNISWNISVFGGSLDKINRTKSGTIDEIRAGKSKIIRLIPVIGLGKIDVLVKATMPMMNTIKKAKQGLIFGSVCILLP